MMLFAYLILFLWWIVATLTMPIWFIVFIVGVIIKATDWECFKNFIKGYYMLEFTERNY